MTPIARYVIKVVEQTARGNETRLLYAGPLDNTKAVFGVGKFHLFAGTVRFSHHSHVIETRVPEIHEEAGAFTVADIDTAFTLVMPTQDQYESYDIRADIKKFKDIGDASRIAMILQVISHLFKVIGSAISDFSGGRLNKAEGLLVQS